MLRGFAQHRMVSFFGFCGSIQGLLSGVAHRLALHLSTCGEAVDVDEAYGGGVVELILGGVGGKFEVVEGVG